MVEGKLSAELLQYSSGEPPPLLHAVLDEWSAEASSSGASKKLIDLLPRLSHRAAAVFAIALGSLVENGAPLTNHISPLVDLLRTWGRSLVEGHDVDRTAFDMLAQSVVAHVARDDASREALSTDEQWLLELERLEGEDVYGAAWVRQLLRGRRGELILVDVNGEAAVRLHFENMSTCKELIVVAQQALGDGKVWSQHPSASLSDPFAAWGHYALSASTLVADAIHGDESPDVLRREDGRHVLFLQRNQHGALRWSEWEMGARLEAALPAVDIVEEDASSDMKEMHLPVASPDGRDEVESEFGLYDDDDDTRAVASCLKEVGADFAEAEGWLHGQRGVALRADTHAITNDDGEQTSVVFEVTICFPDNRIVFESFAGWGSEPNDQVQNAIDNFAHNSLDVLAEAYGGGVTDGPVNVYDFEENDVQWRAVVGSVGLRTAEDDLPEVAPEMLDALSHAIRTTKKSAADHAFRVFFAFAGGECISSEALMDGEPWDDGLAAMANVSWPMTKKYTSFRVFAVVHADVGPGHSSCSIDEAVSIAADGFRAGASEETIFGKLCTRGVTARDAELMIALVPMAFAEVLMPRAKWPTTFLVDENTGRKQLTLDRHPIYEAARTLAHGDDERDVIPVARVSAQFDVAMQLNEESGQELDFASVEFVFTEPVLCLDRFVPRVLRVGNKFVRRHAGSDAQPTEEEGRPAGFLSRLFRR